MRLVYLLNMLSSLNKDIIIAFIVTHMCKTGPEIKGNETIY